MRKNMDDKFDDFEDVTVDLSNKNQDDGFLEISLDDDMMEMADSRTKKKSGYTDLSRGSQDPSDDFKVEDLEEEIPLPKIRMTETGGELGEEIIPDPFSSKSSVKSEMKDSVPEKEIAVKKSSWEEELADMKEEKTGAADEDDFKEIRMHSRGDILSEEEKKRQQAKKEQEAVDNLAMTVGQATENYLDHIDEMDEDASEVEEAVSRNPVAEEIRMRAAAKPEENPSRRRGKRFRRREEDTETETSQDEYDEKERWDSDDEEVNRRNYDESYDEDDYDDYDEPDDYDDDYYEENEKGKTNKKKIALFGIAGVAVLGICAFTVGILMQNQQKINFYRTHFLPNTIINGIDCGDKSPDEAKEAFADVIDQYTLVITGRDDDVVLSSDDAEMTMNFDVDFSQLLNQQDHSKFREAETNPENYTITTAVSINEDSLRGKISSLDMFIGMTESKSCEITYNSSTNLYELQDGIRGNMVDVEAVSDRVVECFSTLETTLDLEAEGFYGDFADVTDEVRASVDDMNRCMRASIELDFDDAGSESLEMTEIQKCLKLDDDCILQFDTTPLKEWVKGLADKYDTYGKSHEFYTTSGFNIQVNGGTYGWKMDQDATVAAIQTALLAGERWHEEPTYSQKAESHTGSDVGNTYIEVNLNSQKMYYYENGVLLISSNVVSGDVSDGNITPTGVYMIYSMERDYVLKGENNSYNTKVSYWMPFYGGYGFHDASWRDSFGGDIYLTNGSHGCVNLPSSVAAELYSSISEGTPVIIFGGETSYTDVPESSTTQTSTTQAHATQAPTTQAPTTQSPTTQAPTTQAPTTQAPTEQEPTEEPDEPTDDPEPTEEPEVDPTRPEE
ncbi:MAG: L,D-transpeptidase family protein [Clostridiales bacterium]|nr:L,D-transpeptidase family protein [Clostridiales bacterium]